MAGVKQLCGPGSNEELDFALFIYICPKYLMYLFHDQAPFICCIMVLYAFGMKRMSLYITICYSLHPTTLWFRPLVHIRVADSYWLNTTVWPWCLTVSFFNFKKRYRSKKCSVSNMSWVIYLFTARSLLVNKIHWPEQEFKFIVSEVSVGVCCDLTAVLSRKSLTHSRQSAVLKLHSRAVAGQRCMGGVLGGGGGGGGGAIKGYKVRKGGRGEWEEISRKRLLNSARINTNNHTQRMTSSHL